MKKDNINFIKDKNGELTSDPINLENVQTLLNSTGCGFCLAKFTQVTMHLGTGYVHSCHHPKMHKISVEEIELEEHIIADVKAKKCKFLVLSTMEGWDWPFFEKIPNALHEKYGFDHNEDFVFATGNAKDYWRLTKVYHNWWELNLSIQNFLHFKNMMLPVINGTTLRPKKFIFLNRRPSIERVAAVTYMYECRKDGIMTLAKGDKMWGASYIESSWREAPINYPSIFEEFSDVNLQERVPLKVNDGVDAEIENPVDDTSHEKFQDSYIHIVLKLINTTD